MRYLRYLSVTVVLGLVACGTQSKAPVAQVSSNSPWICVGDTAKTWRCARGQAPDIAKKAVEPEPEPEPQTVTSSDVDDQPLSSEQLQDLLISEPIGIVAAGGVVESSVESGESVESSGQDASVQGEPDIDPVPEGLESHVDDEQLILETADGYFAVQVIAAKSAQEVADYFEPTASTAANASSSALTIRILSQGNVWYVGIAGLYPDYPGATAAVRALPISATAWIRPVRGLKQAILAARQL